MKKPFMQVASDGAYELIVEGMISGEMWWGDEFTPDMVREELAKANGNPIRIIINSPGGECFAGAAIYNALAQYEGRKTVRVDGVAASMASIIAMVGDEIYMSPGSTMMIHRPSVGAWGNIDDLKKAINMLEALEETMIPIYQERTGMSKDEIFTLLDKETWMSPSEAVELGFADKLVDEDKAATSAFDKIKAMLGNEQFAFSMSAVHKSLEDYVATAKAPEKEEGVEDDNPATTPSTDEVVEQPNEVETPNETEVEQTGDGEREEPSVEETPEAPEVTEPEAAATIKPVAKVKDMTNVIAADEVVAPVALADPAVATAEDKKITKNEARRMIVSALAAKYAKDEAEFERIDKELKASMVIDGSTGGNGEYLYGQEVLASDIRERYERTSKVGAMVNRIDIEGAETYAQLVETAGNGFTEVALGGVKDQDQPTWTKQSQTPHEWALIVAWLDGVQKRSPIAVYNRIVRYIAKQYSKLESKIVLTYEGGTFDGEVRPATGLVPLLTTASRVVDVASYDSQDLLPAMGDAYGDIESDDELVLVANRRTWGHLAVSLDNNANPVFVRVGEKIAAGALGEFTLVQDNELEDGQVVFGVMEDYDLVLRGSLEYLFSREATIGTGESALNLFTQDASALRADVDITGAPVFLQSFVLLEIASES